MIKKISKNKKLLLLCLSILLLFILLRYGWRIQGLKACDSAYEVKVKVNGNVVEATGYTLDPFGHFIGHIYKIDGDKVYFGVKHREFLGVLPGDKMSFKITIPIKEQISEVYFCVGENELLEWSKQE